MNNFKKIGLTALAGSLVATSAFAGEMSVAGSASMNVEHTNGGAANTGKTFSMGNQLTFSGSGELDNGLTVSLSFILDQGDDKGTDTTADDNAGAPFDSHSVSISSDTLGTLKLAGEGGGNAQTALDTTAAGDIFDAFDGTGDLTPGASATGNNSIQYALPSIMDDLSLNLTYLPAGSGTTSSTHWGATYTGVDGLSVSYGVGEGNSTSSTLDVTSMSATYAYGPVTVGYSNTEYDISTASSDKETSSFSVSYTVSDELSVTYGQETIESDATAAVVDGEYDGITVAYTAGGMTITAKMQGADNIDGTTTATKDRERWALGASFAF
ncbi:porin [Candidatus Pelagibacter sp.]|nr:porin [Candidatus Pelagibacter sp.]|tara:strand:+ start:40 stop:1017 length:978 start_codon:yes stop_codon:yes gene_type:complete